MSAIEIVLGILLIIASIVMIVVIILQEGNQQGVGVVSGGADTFFSKNKARSYDAFLARATKWFAIGFVAVILALNIVAYVAANKSDTAEDVNTSSSDSSQSQTTDATNDEATPGEASPSEG